MKFKMKVLCVLIAILLCVTSRANDRRIWIDYLNKISYPVLKYAASDSLKILMPVYNESRNDFQYLEALGRTICGVAPWLELGEEATEEGKLRKTIREYALQAIRNSVNPHARDYMNFSDGTQPLVDAAYLALGLLRAPEQLWGKLDDQTRQRIITELQKTRRVQPHNSNWLLFASVVEACLLEYNGSYDNIRLRKGVEEFLFSYYHGDGMYGDGRNFSMDYYNSYVIHPMLAEVIGVGVKHDLKDFKFYQNVEIPRLSRYAEIQERMISPEGTYPVIGRTLICKNGAFHALAEASLLNVLPDSLPPGQVRSAMTAVLIRQYANEKSFDEQGFLSVGFVGKQNSIAESYVSSGSAYHCLTFFLPLGLDINSAFWSEPYQKWTSLKAFNGEEIQIDHSFDDSNDRLNSIQYLWHISFSFRIKVIFILIACVILITSVLGLIKIYDVIKKLKIAKKHD